jgi:hypothetical protein
MSKHLFRILLALALLGGVGATPSVADQIACDSNRDVQDRGQKVCLEACDSAYKNDAKKKDGCRGSCVKTWLYCVDKIKADERKAAEKSIACHEPIVKCIAECRKTKDMESCQKSCFRDNAEMKKTYEACLKK